MELNQTKDTHDTYETERFVAFRDFSEFFNVKTQVLKFVVFVYTIFWLRRWYATVALMQQGMWHWRAGNLLLRQVAPALLPFVRLFDGQPSVYCWWDDAGTCRDICQAEGCEQGDALAPALFSLRQHDGLERAAAELRPGEELLAYLETCMSSPARCEPSWPWTSSQPVSKSTVASRPTSVKRGSTTQPAVRHRAGSLSSATASLHPRSPNRARRLRARMRTAGAAGPFAAIAGLAVCVARATSHPKMCGRAPRDATVQCARHYRRALESQRPKGNLLRPRPGPLQQRPACSLPCALRRLPTGVPGRTRWAIGTYGNHAWRRHVYKSTAGRRRRPTGPLRGPRRCQPSAKRGLAGMPHLGRTPQHLMPPQRSWSSKPGSQYAARRWERRDTLSPRQWLSHTSAPGVPTTDRRRLDLVVYGASPQGLALCCDATLDSPITGASAPHPRADHTPGIALRMAESR